MQWSLYIPLFTPTASSCCLIHAQIQPVVNHFKMLKKVRAAKNECAMTLYTLQKLFSKAWIDTTGPALSTFSPLSPLTTKQEHLSLGQPQRAELFLMIFPLSDTP